MGRIKSTMEMVLERAAKMGAGPGKKTADNKVEEGMRLGAAYLRDEVHDLGRKLDEAPDRDRKLLQQGAARTLLRNIVLPRDAEQQKPAAKAMEGLLEIGGSGSELLEILGNMKKILDQYLAHRQQLKAQLESGLASQMEMMEQNIARQTGMAMKLDPSQHPKFREEWQRVVTELNDRYGRELDRHKRLVEQGLAP